MTEQERKHVEERLLQERDRATRMIKRIEAKEQVSQHESAGELSKIPSHMADEGSQTQEQERDFILLNRESRVLNLIDRALELLREDPETFARCEECGRDIEFERFDLIPWTRLCARSAKKQEGPADRASAAARIPAEG
ncbi:MAG: TraR/DksA C4-type zinc finger protein [Gemmatimonadota bacterium]